MPEPVRGVEGWRQNFGGFLAAFPDYTETLEDLVGEGAVAVARITFQATHQGDLMGIPPTGKRVEVGGMAFLHSTNGQIAEQWAAADMLGMMQQLGVIPASAQATG